MWNNHSCENKVFNFGYFEARLYLARCIEQARHHWDDQQRITTLTTYIVHQQYITKTVFRLSKKFKTARINRCSRLWHLVINWSDNQILNVSVLLRYIAEQTVGHTNILLKKKNTLPLSFPKMSHLFQCLDTPGWNTHQLLDTFRHK